MRTTIFLAILLAASAPAMADIAGITTQPVNIPASATASALDTSGNLWIVDSKQNSVGRLTPAGAFTLFPIPTASAQPLAIAAAPDGNLWFVETGPGALPKGKVAKITPSGSITEFPIPATMTGGPWQIAVANDGSVWFLELIDGVHVGRLGTDGTFAEFAPKGAQFLAGIAPADVGLWLIDTNANMIWKMGTDGSIGLSSTIATGPQYSGARGVTALDGTFWFIHGTNSIARVAPGGDEKEYAVPTANANPAGIAVGNDGNIWFSEYSANQIGQLVVSTADSSGHATINESSPFGAKLSDIFFLPPASSSGSIVTTAARGKRALAGATTCDSPQGIVRKDDGTSGNLIAVKFVPPKNCADMAVEKISYLPLRDGLAIVNVSVRNGGKDDATGGVLQFSLFPTVTSGTQLVSCRGSSCQSNGGTLVCSGFSLAADDTCEVSSYIEPFRGVNDIVIASATASSPLYDQNLSNNSAVLRIDTRTNDVTDLPPDSNTPPVPGAPKRGGH
ncbi:MAG TPA: hypothetical protein VL284_11830 [Thermoanaerobaculia bacterium]|nr:hypothetical protein [Thermoanaerobaculia bacterium]